ncbi:16S rRNA (uracil(1498)-N(3))-methyltransferase [Rickettsiales endosymbiont of Peranema trichophorum]|uniref:RsmE family RNA methyltransferase n=1 Tax=Rickettsiales endosymbiont of Peranema trichophorum TaxID=2486577 RepID=UPI001023CF45|nr:RsmE family RNA methyltransferase [Rickettsiales endosymbiont of Peranema trichophorum]RZI47623.1 16S rRNA (uracil(1498)-N(3))-methyltransferase [Rickettsiales endosymbiont of Peranema trichophorum]
MSLRTRVFSAEKLKTGAVLKLTAGQEHYLAKVLRMKSKERLKVFNGTDGEWLAEFLNAGCVRIMERLKLPSQEQSLHLAFSPLKGNNTAFIVEKATELGVTEMWPIITSRTVVNKVNEVKLTTIAIEATEQSERFVVPQIHPMQTLRDFLNQRHFDGSLLFCNERTTASQQLSLNQLQSPNASPRDDCILIGPEGGFSEDEVTSIRGFGERLLEISLGKRILRAETAAIAAISLYNTVHNNWL